jgi:hypothetical protein
MELREEGARLVDFALQTSVISEAVAVEIAQPRPGS